MTTYDKQQDRRLQAKRQKAAAAMNDAKKARVSHNHNRLPPGQVQVEKFPVLDLGIQPAISHDDWHLTVNGLVQKPQRFTWQQLQALPQEEFISDIHCVTSWSRFDNHWRGVSVRHLLEAVQPLADARFVLIASFDDYTTNMPLADFAHEDCLLATHWEGAPLTKEHGAPVRLIVPHLYLWKSAKWIKEITFLNNNQRGFWEQNGYHNDASPWQEQRYSWQEK